MRQLLIRVPRGGGDRIVGIAREHEATHAIRFEGRDETGSRIDVVVVHLPNRRLGAFVDALEPVPDTHVSFQSVGSLTLQPPESRVPDELAHVTARSPLEVFIGGVQSVGTWTGMLGYAAAAGVVVWLGLLTNTPFLLVGAMLIAPFAGPAMNAAIATARGDAVMLGRSVLRYGASLAVTSVTAWLLSLAFGIEAATRQMVDIANVSGATVLLPLAAGAAGALHLSLADRNSLVSGAAVGLLVAAALAPPAGLVGMAAALGDTAMLEAAGFLLTLQLVGINLAGAFVFRLFGLDPAGPRWERGTPRAARISATVSIIAIAGLLVWQFAPGPPGLRRATIQQRAHAAIVDALAAEPRASLVLADVRFPRPPHIDDRTLLVQLWVRPARSGAVELGGGEGDTRSDAGNRTSDAQLELAVAARVHEALARRDLGARPLITVTVVAPPSGPER